jgi:hypothetical protein
VLHVRLLSVYRECASVAANSTPTTWQTQPRDFSFSAADPEPGKVQTEPACREEYECDHPDHWTQEFFGTDSTWMLKHTDDDQCRKQPQEDALDPRNYKGDSSDHGSSQFSISAVIGGWLKQPRYLVGVTGFLGDGIDLAELPSDGIDPPLSTSMPPFRPGSAAAA